MKFLNKVPFLRLILPFILGILFSTIFHGKFSLALWMLLILFSLTVIAGLSKFVSENYKARWIFGLLLNVTLFLFGATMVSLNTEVLKKSHFSNYISFDDHAVVVAEIIESPETKQRSVKTVVEIQKIQDGAMTRTSSGKSIIYISLDAAAKSLEFGQGLLLKLKLKEIKGPGNPEAFDYKSFLASKNIYHQGFVAAGDWRLLDEPKTLNLFVLAMKLRKHLFASLKKSGLDGEELAVVAALTLGTKAGLDPALKTSYARAGAMHVLAVSGLHVGIIFLVLNYLFIFMEKLKRGGLVKAATIIIFLWFYAILTGLSPSVMRAVTMFSFIAFGSAFNRHTNIYNTLFVSAFFLLLFDPFLLKSVGFQLSYFAVFGIVGLYPFIYKLWKTNFWLLDKVWVLMSVSLAAQISTFPLGMYYFHQFPNYFLLSNLVVVPLVTLVIYLSILTYAFSPIAMIAGLMGSILSFSVSALNLFVKWIERLPYSVTEGIYISAFETILIYLIISSGIAFLVLAKNKMLWLCLILTIVFLVCQL